MSILRQRLTKTIAGDYTTTDADIGYRLICNNVGAATITLHSPTGRTNFDLDILNVGAGDVLISTFTLSPGAHAHLGNNGGNTWAISISASAAQGQNVADHIAKIHPGLDGRQEFITINATGNLSEADSSKVILCSPSAAIDLTLPLSDPNLFYTLKNQSAHNVTLLGPQNPDNYVVSLLHFDGLDGDIPNTDEMGMAWSKTSSSNNHVKVSTDQSVFGGASAYFDGTGDLLVSDISNPPQFQFGTGDFTIDFWFRLPSFSAFDQFVGQYLNSTNRWHIAINDYITFFMNVGGTALWTYYTPDIFVANTWTHVEIGRHGDDIHIFINGVKQSLDGNATASTYMPPGTAFPEMATPVSIGARRTGTTTYDRDLIGYLDELRISKGICRHTESFSVPTEPYTPVFVAKIDNDVGGLILSDLAACKLICDGANWWTINASASDPIVTEADPIFVASPAYGITTEEIAAWNNPPTGGGSTMSSVFHTNVITLNTDTNTFDIGIAEFDNTTDKLILYQGGIYVTIPAEATIGATAITKVTGTWPSGTVFDVLVIKAGSEGVTTLLELTDTPSTYTDMAGKILAVNATENAVEFIDAPSVGGDSGILYSDILLPFTETTVSIPTTNPYDPNFNPLIFTLTSDAIIEVDAYIYLTVSGAVDWFWRISDDNFTTFRDIDMYVDNTEPKYADIVIQGIKARLAAVSTYETIKIPTAYLSLYPGSWKMKLIKKSTGSATIAGRSGFVLAKYV